jgi:chromatin remodeling complex protein RSC6
MSKSTKKSKSVSTTESDLEAKVSAVVPSEPVETESKDNLNYTSYIELQNEISSIQERLSVLRTNLKKYLKLTTKQMDKMNKKRRQNTNLRSPTGFGKPCFVPTSLRTLLKIREDECVTRPTVTKKLYSYIKENSLFDNNDKRLLRVNDSLSKALQLSPQEVKLINSSTSPYLPYDGKEKKQVDKNAFSFYNIQRYVARLYPKQDTEKNKQVVEVKKEKAVVEVVADIKSSVAPVVKKSK